MASLKGVEESFDECLKLAPRLMIEGIEVPVYINHLIANKKKSTDPKTSLIVIELEKIKKLKDEMKGDSNPL